MDSQLGFFIAIFILTITPGVDTVLVIRNTSRGGILDGWVTSIAICCGLFVHAILSSIGISLILMGSSMLFTLLKLVGAGYLVWLGTTSLRQSWRAETLRVNEVQSASPAIWRSIREGLLSNLLNPKTIVFYMALLPGFIDTTSNAFLQALWLALMHFLLSVFWLGLVTLLAHKMALLIKQRHFKRWLDGILGATLSGLGIGLAFEAYQHR